VLSFPQFEFWPFAWIALVPLFIALQDKRPLFAFGISYLVGFISFLGLIYWLAYVSIPGVFLLCLYLAAYFGVFGLLASRCLSQDSALNPYLIFFAPSLWVSLEWLRGHLFTGFGWALLGYSQYRALYTIQIADITGVYGVSFLIVMTNVAIWQLLRQGRCWRQFSWALLLIALTLLYGHFRLTHLRGGPGLKIGLIQGNVPQEQKWDQTYKEAILNKYINLTKMAFTQRPDLIIWPETAVPAYLDSQPSIRNRLLNLARDIDLPLLAGAPISRLGQNYNSALLISAQGKVARIYDKLRLVPFGEYIPKPFSFLRSLIQIGDFTPGREYTIFDLNRGQTSNSSAVKFAVLICFEDIFPELSREFVKRGAQFLVNITNDAWFRESSNPFQHLQASVFRAVENRLNVVRCANTGVSGFIEPSGKVLDLISRGPDKDIFISGTLTREIKLAPSGSFYSRFGDIFVAVACAIAILGSMRLVFEKKQVP
jgi:apolipoprotein N-acyltransferase